MDENDNTIAIKTAMANNGESRSNNAESKIRNGIAKLFRYLFLAAKIIESIAAYHLRNILFIPSILS
jgi:hypothetical protein